VESDWAFTRQAVSFMASRAPMAAKSKVAGAKSQDLWFDQRNLRSLSATVELACWSDAESKAHLVEDIDSGWIISAGLVDSDQRLFHPIETFHGQTPMLFRLGPQLAVSRQMFRPCVRLPQPFKE
jgi:hypothetical protein